MWRSAAEDRSWLIEALIVYLTLHVLREKHNKNQEKPRGMATKTYLSSSVRGSFTYVEVPTWYKSSLSPKIFSLSREKRAILGGVKDWLIIGNYYVVDQGPKLWGRQVDPGVWGLHLPNSAAGPNRCLCGNLEGEQHGCEGWGGGMGSSPVSSQVGGKAGEEKEL